jgi:sodium-dependent dicarboxylate transporter 2/3/5
VSESPRSRWALLHTLGGPATFLALAASPVAFAPYPVRASLGLLVWMAWWWVTEPVHLAVTGLLPIVVLALFNFAPVASVLPAYSEQLVILIVGANILASLWRRWGLDRRIALVSLVNLGTSTRQQLVVWFLVAAVLSSVLPNAVVAASLMPIVIAMLRYLGIDDLRGSAFGSALLIAVAWGTSIGGAGTPLGGAHNVLAVQFIERQLVDHEFLFTTWLGRVLPLTVVLTVVSAVFLRRALPVETERVEGSRTYFASELTGLGPMSVPERWGLVFFGAATLLAFTRQLYAAALPGLAPAFVFLAFAVASFAVRYRGEPILTWPYAQQHMEWGLFYLFAGGSALGQILSDSGTATFLAEGLTPLAGGGGFVAVAVFSLLALVLTQITSNTAAVAIMLPITISTFQGLGMNPVPFVYIVTTAANCGIALPSSSAGPAIAAGYGVNLRTMLVRGLQLTMILWVVLLVLGYLAARYWPGFGVA